MAKSSIYEKYIVRKPAMLIHEAGEYGKGVYKEILPPDKKAPGLYIHENESGIQIAMSKTLVPDTHSTVEYGLIWGDTAFGVKKDTTRPHKHYYEEMFLFIGTNPDDVDDLGAEVEFWLGEGEELEKVVFNTSSCMYLPPGVAHFPQFIRNVKRPLIEVVIIPQGTERDLLPVDLHGRPTYD
jgi:hypothetical protein